MKRRDWFFSKKKGTKVRFCVGVNTWQLLQLCVRRFLNSNNHKLSVGGKMELRYETVPFGSLSISFFMKYLVDLI